MAATFGRLQERVGSCSLPLAKDGCCGPTASAGEISLQPQRPRSPPSGPTRKAEPSQSTVGGTEMSALHPPATGAVLLSGQERHPCGNEGSHAASPPHFPAAPLNTLGSCRRRGGGPLSTAMLVLRSDLSLLWPPEPGEERSWPERWRSSWTPPLWNRTISNHLPWQGASLLLHKARMGMGGLPGWPEGVAGKREPRVPLARLLALESRSKRATVTLALQQRPLGRLVPPCPHPPPPTPSAPPPDLARGLKVPPLQSGA